MLSLKRNGNHASTDLNPRSLKARQHVYLQEDVVRGVYMLKQGYILLYRLTETGSEIGYWVIKPGELFGDEVLDGVTVRRYCARAIHPSIVQLLPSFDYTTLLRLTLDRARQLEARWMQSHCSKSAERIAVVLQQYPFLQKEGYGRSIAALAAVSREYVSREKHQKQ